jgi:hypothetical protein
MDIDGIMIIGSILIFFGLLPIAMKLIRDEEINKYKKT